MYKYLFVVVSLVLNGTAVAQAANIEAGARYGRTVEQDGGNFEIAARYFPIKFLSVGASLGYARIEYDKSWYTKRVESMPLGGYINAHLPLPGFTPYAGVGGILYAVSAVTSPNSADKDKERNGTTTVQGGVEINILPRTSFNIEVRRLVNDRQTMVLGGVWFRF